ncbi:FeoB-associated Cys-rich membrane protein [Veillonella sp. R32]|uniref:FeoB-associated Cys-rich membrane protein n=1 Tax=Veillonella sp. R32 TaxID=2021312 RepID=UPI001389A897|nr:FeoB-associated Cys-rich membrane protein [Veillonella sp. R32]KAF1680698.1 FeoB-associated Cys-rich membrane protein [Veillonella sp. R32]
MENLIVYLIGLIAVLFVVRKAYKTMSGKGGCSCGCGGSGKGKKNHVSSTGCGCGCGGSK